MAAQDITSSNSTFVINVAGLFNVPVTLQNYGAERFWENENLAIAETKMSIDGKLNAGYVPNEIKQKITLSAASSSILVFETIIATTRATRSIYRINGMLTIPSLGRKYTLTNGLLTEVSISPNAAKLLEDRDFSITWENFTPAGI